MSREEGGLPRDGDDLSSETLLEQFGIPAKADMSEEIEVLVQLVDYSDQFYRYHYVDGGHDFHKISAFRIIEPEAYEDQSLNVRHIESPEPDSQWRDIGVVMRLRMPKASLDFVVGQIGSLVQ